jgi:uncharacterized protein YlxW (UPF0749 family)
MEDQVSIETDLGWLKTHLLLLFLVAGLTFGGVYGVEAIVSSHDSATASKFEAIAKDTAAQNAQIQASTQAQIASLTAQVQSLTQAVVARDAQLVKTKAIIPSLTPTQVASAIQPLLSKGTATADPTGAVLLSQEASQEVLGDLEELPVDRADIASLNAIVSNQTTEISSLQTALSSVKTSHQADKEANAKEVSALKASARKSKLKWFGLGFVTGLLAGHALGL